MTKFLFRSVLVAVILIVFFSPIVSLPACRTSFSEFFQIGPVRPAGSLWGSDTFTSSYYCDGSQTNASGWGSGAVVSGRDYEADLFARFSVYGGVQSLSLQGREAYVATSDASPPGYVLRILNITSVRQVSLLTSWAPDWPLAYDVEVDGDILYAVSKYGDLRLYNVSNPHGTPVLMDYREDFGSQWPDIDKQGRFLFAACYQLQILNIEDPYNIYSVSNTSLPGSVLGVDVQGDIAYLASNYGFYVVDVSNPYSPTALGNLTLGTVSRVHVEDDIVFLLEHHRLRLVDVSRPENPVLLGQYDATSNLQAVALQGKTLYIGDDEGRVMVLDVTDPRHPVCVHEFTVASTCVNDMAIYGGDLVVATASGIETYRVCATGGGMTGLQQFGTFPGSQIIDAAVIGDVALVAAGSAGLLVLNVSDPLNVVLLDQVNHTQPVEYVQVEIRGRYCFVVDSGSSQEGLLSFNITDPSDIQYMDRYPAEVSDMALIGDVAYLATGTGGLQLVNISTPADLSMCISTVTDGTSFNDVCVQGHLIYSIAFRNAEPWDYLFNIYDATNLTDVILVSSASKPAFLLDVAVEGDVCVLAEGDRGISLQNVTDPHNVVQLSSLDFLGGNLSSYLSLFGPYVIVSEAAGGIHLVNATNPRDTKVIDSCNATSFLAIDATIHGDFLYVAGATSLIVYRLFRSAGNTYHVGASVAQSLDWQDSSNLIENATLSFHGLLPSGTSIVWQLTADGGEHWDDVTPETQHSFAFRGEDLRWRAILSTGHDDRSARLYQVDIAWSNNEPPMEPTLNPPVDPDMDGNITVTWSTGFDSDGVIDHYVLQMSNGSTFDCILREWTVNTTSQAVSGLIGRTYYFRVQAFDNDGVASLWSDERAIDIANQPPTAPTLADPGSSDDDGVFTVSWTTSVDPEGSEVSYTLQMFDTETMDNSLTSWSTWETSMSVNVSSFGSGTYYFAVRAEEGGHESDWSNVESIVVSLSTTTTTTTGPPFLDPLTVVGLASLVLVVLVLLVLYQKRRRPTG